MSSSLSVSFLVIMAALAAERFEPPKINFSLETIQHLRVCGPRDNKSVPCIFVIRKDNDVQFVHVLPKELPGGRMELQQNPLTFLSVKYLTETKLILVLLEKLEKKEILRNLIVDISNYEVTLLEGDVKGPWYTPRGWRLSGIVSKPSGFDPLIRRKYDVRAKGAIDKKLTKQAMKANEKKAAALREKVVHWIQNHDLEERGARVFPPSSYPDIFGGIMIELPNYLITELKNDFPSDISQINLIPEKMDHAPLATDLPVPSRGCGNAL